ncbi:uncharacterized protein LOC124111395 [Haliotis rufescens]|uniref:uncharacterized protein LOC124111395 n=1 Tax=Haliotis rufescens TaxID=6454 RepID=UPI00201EE5C8|nr:uncharacterized protein LOC124111395 [Haliotis rufescens]
MTTQRVIPLTVTSRYARSWGTWEGIRELVQNWHDGLHSMAAMLDDLPLDTSVKVEFRCEKNVTEQKYEAFIKNPVSKKEKILGHLIYNVLENRLMLTNECTALQKKILLLGYSAKADTKEVIGQFGEGLKIGALALVRQGHLVTMETGSDIWEFQLLHNEEFGEKVLSVVISERLEDLDSFNQGESDTELGKSEKSYTCTKISGVENQHWKKFLPRFLFLRPPADFVKTELGTLLLDPHHNGQLYMKGIWVSDLSQEDLAAGVDFVHLQLDRDRNAVPKPSEIDHQVSGMWIRALQKKPSLAEKYYHLLFNDKYRDVRHAADYATPEMALVIADQFLKQYGDSAFPVLNNTEAADIQAVRDELHRTAVLCNDTMIKLLIKSGRYGNLNAALTQQRMKESVTVPYSSLSSEQRRVLQEAVSLTNMADPSFSLAVIDVIDTPRRETCSERDSRVCIPTWMMDLEAVHTEMNFNPSQLKKHVKCKCRESVMCHAVLETRKHLMTLNLLPTTEAGGHALSHYPLVFVVAALAAQVCGKASDAYCASIHQQDSGSTGADDTVSADLQQREQGYLDTIKALQAHLELMESDSIKSLSTMERKLKSAETQLMQKEVDLVNEEALVQTKFEKQLKQLKVSAELTVKDLKTRLQSQDRDMTNMSQKLHHKAHQLQQVREELEDTHRSLEKKNIVLLEELSHYITQNRNRTVSLSRLSKEGCQNDDTVTREKWTLISNICDMVLEELQSEKFICAVCKIKRKSRMLYPCGHYSLCEDCADQMLQGKRECPICKQHVTSHTRVYE